MADLKLDLFIKVLLMTTSDTDGEALAALRRANAMLKTANTDWEKLLRGKVTVVADPFSNIAPPQERHSNTVPQPPAPPRAWTPPTPKTPPRPAAPQYKPTPQSVRQNNTNHFAGHCFNCDTRVDSGMGALRDIPTYGTKIWCEDCNFRVSTGNLLVSDAINRYESRRTTKQATASRPPRTKRKVTTADLMADIFQTKDT